MFLYCFKIGYYEHQINEKYDTKVKVICFRYDKNLASDGVIY